MCIYKDNYCEIYFGMGYKYGGQDKKDKNTSMAFKIQYNMQIQDS